MEKHRWEKIERIFSEAISRPEAERPAFVERQCSDDPELCRDILALIDNDRRDDGFLTEPVFTTGLHLLTSDLGLFSESAEFGSYRIQKLIGRGGTGAVFLASDARLERPVALKILTAAYLQNNEMVLRFQQEARMASNVSHPNVAHIYEFGECAGRHFLAMEYVRGRILRELINEKSIDCDRAVEIARQIASALAAAHKSGIVHRDIKPENIIITEDGIVKVLDFGIAKQSVSALQIDSNDNNALFETVPGMILGTIAYMSPEQVRGTGVDHRTDIWSLGMILYEMLTGERPFKDGTAADTMSAILSDKVRNSAEFEKKNGPILLRIVNRCLAKDVKDRFQSARDLAFALETFHQEIRPYSFTFRRPSWKKSLWLSVLLVSIITAFLIAGNSSGVKQNLNALFAANFSPEKPLPLYHQITFQRGTVWSARFSPDDRSIIYSATWRGEKLDLFSTRPDSRESRQYNLPSTNLLSISAKGEMALLLTRQYLYQFLHRGTLARMPIDGAVPREVAEDVQEADWSPDGEDLAIVRWVNGRNQLEYPIGNVLYQTSGYINNLRISPKADLIAFADHPKQWDNRGYVSVIDTAGNKQTLTEEWGGLEGLAWNPVNNEIWFTASKTGEAYSLYTVNMRKETRLAARVPSNLMIYDVSKTGQVLLSRALQFTDIYGNSPDRKNDKNLSWLGIVGPSALSMDGKQFLFTYFGQGSGTNYSTFLRKTDGIPAIRLGEGRALALSPDGNFALVKLNIPEQLNIIPVKSGELKQLPKGNIEHFDKAAWFPDGQNILFTGNVPGESKRCYVQNLAGGNIEPLTPEGITGTLISPGGTIIVVSNTVGEKLIYRIDSGKSELIKNITETDEVIGWSTDDRSIFVFNKTEIPIKIYRLSIDSGRRELLKEINPADAAGIFGTPYVFLTPDAKSYIYGLRRYMFDLYMVEHLSSDKN